MSLSKKTVSFLIISSLLSVGIGTVSLIIYKNSNFYIIGLLSFLIINILRYSIIVERANHINSQVLSLLHSIDITDNFNEIIFTLGLKKLISNYQEGKIEVEKKEVYNFWYESISKMKTSFEVLTYALPDETWKLGWNKVAIGIQQERIAHECKIDRVFILDAESELKEYLETFQEQKEIGVNVSWIKKSELMNNQLISNAISKIGTIDFAIIDKRWINRTYLNKNRNIKKSDATMNKELLEDAKMIFRQAKKNAIEF